MHDFFLQASNVVTLLDGEIDKFIHCRRGLKMSDMCQIPGKAKETRIVGTLGRNPWPCCILVYGLIYYNLKF